MGLRTLTKGLIAFLCVHSVSAFGGRQRNTPPDHQWTICAKCHRDQTSGGCASDCMAKGRSESSQPMSKPLCGSSQWSEPGREASADLSCWGIRSLSPSPITARPGKEVLPALSTLLQFISICFFHLLSRIIVLLGLGAWEGKRCAFLFINSLTACFKLKPTPHAGLHRNNIKTDCLPACCYQYQCDLNLLSLLTWGHPFWKHLAIT